MRLHCLSGQSILVFVLTVRKFFLCSDGFSCLVICAHCLLSQRTTQKITGYLIFFPSHQAFIHIAKITLSILFSRLKRESLQMKSKRFTDEQSSRKPVKRGAAFIWTGNQYMLWYIWKKYFSSSESFCSLQIWILLSLLLIRVRRDFLKERQMCSDGSRKSSSVFF